MVPNVLSAERRDQMFGPKPEKRLVDSHKIGVIQQQKSTSRHNIFQQLIRSSFDRPNANEMKLLRRRIRALQQRAASRRSRSAVGVRGELRKQWAQTVGGCAAM